jgi:hypothetical protein
MASSMRISALPPYLARLRFCRSMTTTPSPWRMGRGRLAPMAVELVDRLTIFLDVRRFLGIGAADSRSWRSGSHVRMHHFVRRSTSIPFRRFLGGGCALGVGAYSGTDFLRSEVSSL